jgi:hypothetical protein
MPFIQLQFRRDTSHNWYDTNPTLASGELAIELDTNMFKIGDGRLSWRSLPYGGIQGPRGAQGAAGGGSGGGGSGAQGPTGPAGTNGAAGPQGIAGSQGSIGPQGPPGSGGSSTTQLTVIKVKADAGNPGGLDTVSGATTTLGSNIASVALTSDSINVIFQSEYTIQKLPLFSGTIYWYNGNEENTYSVIHIPTSTNLSGVTLNLSYAPSTKTLSIGPINTARFPSLTNDSSSGQFAIYVFLQTYN